VIQGDPVLSPLGAGWRLSTTEPPAGWTTAAYNHATWPTAPAEIGKGDGDEATAVAGSVDTFYVRRLVNIPDPGAYTTYEIRLRRDDGAAVYWNGAELARLNLPAGPLTAATRATAAVFGEDETTPVVISVPANQIVAGWNLIAVVMHNVAAGGDLSFDLELVAR
jgi:hypothetical protein